MELKAKEYKKFEDIKRTREDGSEYWSARELANALDYTQWRNFQKVINRAMIACETSGHRVLDDFAEVGKIVEAGATNKTIKDYELSRREKQIRLASLLALPSGFPVHQPGIDLHAANDGQLAIPFVKESVERCHKRLIVNPL